MKENSIKIKIKDGLSLRDPRTGNKLPCEKPLNVQRTQFWLRRLEAGDCELVKEAKKQSKKKSTRQSRAVASPPEEPALDPKMED